MALDLVIREMERVTRIELALSAWEADVLPLNYTRAGEHEDAGPYWGPVARPDIVPDTTAANIARLALTRDGRWPLSSADQRPRRGCPARRRSRCRWPLAASVVPRMVCGFQADARHGGGIRARLPSRAGMWPASRHGLSGSGSRGTDASLRVHVAVTAGKQVGNGAVEDW